MAWQDEADKHVNSPVVFVEIAFNSGTKYYSDTYVETATQLYEGRLMNAPQVQASVGDLKRTHIKSKVELLFNDVDYELRTLEEDETVGIKNIAVVIKIAFGEDSYASTETIFTGVIDDWQRLDNLVFKIIATAEEKNIERSYPEKTVTSTDYSSADDSAVGQIIPIPYGEISSTGLSAEGAFPMLFVDTTTDAERHLAGLQVYDELITNGGFDSDTSGWTAINSATLASVAGGKSGNCLSITENGADSPGARQSITVDDTRHYWFRVYVKAGTENGYLIQLYDSTNSAVIVSSGWLVEAAGDWSTAYEYDFDPPSGCEAVRISLYSFSLNGEGKTIYFDTVTCSEVIDVPKVFINGTQKTEGVGNDYVIDYEIIDDEHIHATVDWQAAVNPTASDDVFCDLKFGERKPVEAIRHFLDQFCGYVSADFNSTSYNAATTIEDDRGYEFAGALVSSKPLKNILNDWQEEFELDIYWNKSDEICFDYLASGFTSSLSHYIDYLHILSQGFVSNPQATKIVNYLWYSYAYRYATQRYYGQSSYEDSASQTKYGNTFRDTQAFRWIRTATIASDIATRKVLRLKHPITFDDYLLPLHSFSDELADKVRITHFCGGGDGGYDEQLCQMRGYNYNLDKLTNKVRLEDVSGYAGNGCILGSVSTQAAEWTSATGSDSDYWYACDRTTGEFSDGKEGKRMTD